MKLFNCIWKNISSLIVSRFIPPLSNELYKGQMGRIGVIGGSADYCGAPYYCGESALKFGADLCSVFCTEEASQPIKSYSPELMVTAFYSYTGGINRRVASFSLQHVMNALPKLHSVAIGPGLGRDPNVVREVMKILTALIADNKQ